MEYGRNCGPWGGIFPVPNAVVDQHIKLCSGVQLKALLLILRQGDAPVDVKAIATTLRLTPDDAADAINYWVECGVLFCDETPGKPAAAPAVAAPPAAVVVTAPPIAPPPEEHLSPATGQKVRTLRSRVKLTTADVNRMAQGDPNVPLLLQETQQLLGRELTSNQTDALLHLYSFMGLTPQYIFTLITYCVSLGKGNLGYVEKVAADWVEKGIDTVEKAESHIGVLQSRNENEQLVRAAFGIHDRDLTSSQKNYVTRWFDGYHMGIEMIKMAFERTVDNTGKVAFPYMDKILHQWSEKGVNTPAKALEEMGARKTSEAAQSEKERPSYDMDRIKKLMEYGNIK